MKIRNLFWGAIAMVALWSCEPNEPDSIYRNTAPIINDQSFSAREDIPDTYIFGTVTAKDEVDNDRITFSIHNDEAGLFEISPSGNLSLIQGGSLDFETSEAHTITVRAYDGIVGRYADITIKVEDVEPEPDSPTVVLQKETLELFAGDMEILTASTTNADGLTIGWTSDNEDVATVDQDGNVTAVSVGTAIITATLAKSSSIATVTVVPSVYVAGFDLSGNNDVAVLWKNGEANNLTDGTNNARASSVFVDDNGIFHVVGHEFINGVKVAMLWEPEGENIKATPLSNPANEAEAQSIFINENGIRFIVGYELHNGTRDAMLWRNQVANVVSNGSSNAYAHEVYVDGTDVYIVGSQSINGTKAAILWFNDQVIGLTDGSSEAQANSVFVQNGNVYVAGQQDIGGFKALLWDSSQPNPTALTNINDGVASSVTGNGTDIFVAGTQTNAQNQLLATLWTNGSPTVLANGVMGDSAARSVFLNDTDVYLTGYQIENGVYMAKLWVNGAQIDLGVGFGTSVFVK
ncbi:Ig-like domain-containing protein [Muricauda sp. CAU 1633]|uniref:Ig-like domain-containing protein n=1 Tax=Allomuricauda sp. CAU 1633 TaxID=2816036 RepID=UPI001A90A5F8|nr:Ig-like domain-containing protein [Muricauda sp. CAU 1633]MBO0320875.1 Ig-like domain-containing protein [Muricauda sp. CAU 1633]